MTFNFTNIKSSMENRLKQQSNWAGILFYGVLSRLIDVIAYITAKLALVVDFFYQESNWMTATLLKSLARKAKFLGYAIHRKIGASGYVVVTGDTSFDRNYTYSGNSVIVSKWERLTNDAGDVDVYVTTQTAYNNGAQTVKYWMDASGVVDEGSDQVGFYLSGIAGGSGVVYIDAGSTIKIEGTDNYDGYHTVDSVSGNKIVIDSIYTAETLSRTDYVIDGQIRLPVSEGIPKTYTYVAEGVENEEIIIYGDSIDNDQIEVFMVDEDDVVLSTVNILGDGDNPDSFYLLQDTSDYYCLIENSVDFESVKITFGDDLYGKKLTLGERVLIKYAETQGTDGDITSTNIVTKFKETIYDSEEEEATLYVTNDEEISNGNDVETVESVRENGRNLFVAGYRAGGNADWVTLLEAHSYINKAKVWADTDTSSNRNKTYVTAVSTDGSDLTTTQKNTVTLYMKEKRSPTEILTWQRLKIIFLFFKITAKVANQPFSTINDEISTLLTTNYDILNVEFQQNVYASNYTRLLDALSNITYHTTELFHLEDNYGNSFAYNTSNHTLKVSRTASEDSDEEDQVLLYPGSTELWLRRKIDSTWEDPVRIARDLTGDGTLTGENGYTIASSSLNYTTNIISFNVSTLADIPTYGLRDTDWILKVAYKTVDGNGDLLNSVRLPSEDLIIDFDSNYIETDLSYA